MSQSLSRDLWKALEGEPTQDAMDIMLVMIEDKDTLERIGVYYTMGKAFQMREKFVCDARELELEDFANLIKNRDPKYARMTVSIVTTMYGFAASPLYGGRDASSCVSRKGVDGRPEKLQRKVFQGKRTEC